MLGPALGQGVAPPPDVDWTSTLLLADEHGLSGALWLAWRRHPQAMPAAVSDRLRATHQSTVGRTVQLRHQAAEAVSSLTAAGLESVLLKGAAHLAAGSLGDLGIREMADIDLLVRADDLARATSALQQIGYRRRPRSLGRRHHDVLFVSDDHAAPIEVHIAVGPPEVAAVLPTDRVMASARPVRLREVEVWTPDPEDVLVHQVLHAHVQDREHAFFGVPLRQLHTSMLLDRHWSSMVDEAAVVGRIRSAGHGAALAGHVDLVHRIFGHPLLAAGAGGALTRAHTSASLAVFALGWPTDLARNLRWATQPDYLHARYGRPPTRTGRAALPLRHLLGVLRSSRRETLHDALNRRR